MREILGIFEVFLGTERLRKRRRGILLQFLIEGRYVRVAIPQTAKIGSNIAMPSPLPGESLDKAMKRQAAFRSEVPVDIASFARQGITAVQGQAKLHFWVVKRMVDIILFSHAIGEEVDTG